MTYLIPNQRPGYAAAADKPDKAKPKHTEAKLQQLCVQWFRAQYPRELLYSNMNHGKRNAISGRLEKLGGFTAGVPDLFLAAVRGGYGGFYIEMKIAPNKPSPEQIAIMKRLESAGYCCCVCYSFEGFELAVNTYLSLTK